MELAAASSRICCCVHYILGGLQCDFKAVTLERNRQPQSIEPLQTDTNAVDTTSGQCACLTALTISATAGTAASSFDRLEARVDAERDE